MKALNPAELKMDLFCKGMRIDPSCDDQLLSVRAGLGSGMEMVIPGDLKDIRVNVPVKENFAQQSPYLLVKREAQYRLLNQSLNHAYTVHIPEEPKWYARKTSHGTPMQRIGVLQDTVLGVTISRSCSYWFHEPASNCKFCTNGHNAGINELAQKRIEEVVETALAAKEESGVSFIHLSGGFQNDRDLDICGAYVKAIKERVGLLVGVQMVPTPN